MDKSKFQLVKVTVASMPIIQKILDRIGFQELLTKFLKNSRYTRSLEGLLKNILIERAALYRLYDWSNKFDQSLIDSESLKDHVVVRALDRLISSDYSSFITKVILKVIDEFDISTSTIHNDSTTVKVCGRYEIQNERTSQLKRGHSKDHRPDLKQLLYNLCVTDDGHIPIYFKTYDGNISDTITHWDTWKSVQGILDKSDFLYIADSKLCTNENMSRIEKEGGKFITILPRNRREVKFFHGELENCKVRWAEVLRRPSRRSSEVEDVFHTAEGIYQLEEGYRIYWYRSSEKQKRDQESRDDRIRQARNDLYALRDQKKRGPKTAKGLNTAADKILKKFGATDWLKVTVEERKIDEFHKVGRGRSTEESTYRKSVKKEVRLFVTDNHTGIEKSKVMDGVFPIVTNSELDAKASLYHYKNQSFVEKRHQLAKTILDVAPVYLKKNDRINALMIIYFLAQLVASLAERELRAGMEKNGHDTINILPEGRKSRTPTWQQINRVLEHAGINTLYHDKEIVRIFPDELSLLQCQILDLLKVSRSCYDPR